MYAVNCLIHKKSTSFWGCIDVFYLM